MERSAGVIMHIASLPGKFGIGTFGKEAYEYVEFLYKSGMRYWQILPLGQTGYGDSPYQSFSAFAGRQERRHHTGYHPFSPLHFSHPLLSFRMVRWLPSDTLPPPVP